MRRFLKAIGCLFLGFLIQDAHASAITVYPLSVDLNSETRYQDVQVHNVGSDTAYVKINVSKIQDPGQADQKLIQLQDNPYQIGLIVTPSKVVIPVGQTRIVRVLYVGEPVTSDILYRVEVSPVTGQLVSMYSGGKQLNAGVQLIIAYGVTVYARPLKLEPNVIAERDGTSLSLHNTGNTSVLITLCKQCETDGTNCTALPDLIKRLFPGSVVEVSLPKDGPLQCQEEIVRDQFVPFNIK